MDTPSQAAALEEEKAGVQAELEAEAVEAAATAEVEVAAQAAAGGGGGGTKDGPSYNVPRAAVECSRFRPLHPAIRRGLFGGQAALKVVRTPAAAALRNAASHHLERRILARVVLGAVAMQVEPVPIPNLPI